MYDTTAADRATAVHEAGHAVVRRLLGLPFQSVSIVGDEGDANGRVAGPGPGDLLDPYQARTDQDHRRTECLCLALLAGHEAEFKYTGRRNPNGAAHDFGTAVQIADRLMSGPDELEEYLDRLVMVCAEMLDEQRTWEAILALADFLLTRGTAGYSEACDVIDPMLERDEDRRQ